jgi:CRP/FNR family transcriptional regulator
MTDIPSCAAGVPFLRVLPAGVLEELVRTMRHRRLERGELLALDGDPVEHLVVVAQGRLKLSTSTTGGREQLLRALGPGEFLGELALFAPAVHEGDLQAVVPSEVCLVSRQAVQELLWRHPAAAVQLIEALAQRLSRAERTIADLGLHDVGQRLAGLLLRAAESGEPTPNGMKIRLPVSWREIAAELGTTPESLSRRLGTLAGEGIIRQERARTVVILAPDRLRQLAEG